MHNQYIPHIKIQPNYIVLYNAPVEQRYSRRVSEKSKDNLKNNSCNGKLSAKSVIKIKNKVNWLLYLTNNKTVYNHSKGTTYQFKLSFITLTLSSKQIHSDNTIKKELLNQFLTEAKWRWGIHHYIWRAEPQANGNIHFHIICDKFIPWLELRNVWNRLQNKLGYVDRYREEMKRFYNGGFKVRKELLKTWSYKNQLKSYRNSAKNDFQSPNSTDVHSLRQVKNPGAYIAKYITKNEDRRLIKGRLWGLSESLSAIDGAIDLLHNDLYNDIAMLRHNHPGSFVDEEYFSLIDVKISALDKEVYPALFKLFFDYLEYLKYQDTKQQYIIHDY